MKRSADRRFAHRLALAVGEADVDAMLRRITAKQFRAWQYYDRLEPFGERRADYRAASIVQMLYNINRGKDQKAISVEECLLQFEEPVEKTRPRQTWQEQERIMLMWAATASKDIN